MKPTLGLYGGSFDPFHVGHLDIVNQAVKVFDTVLVAKGINPTKVDKITSRYPLPEKFLAQLGVHTASYNKLLTDYVKMMEEEYNVTIVRGLRNGADLDYEQNLVAFLREMYPQIKIVAFYCDPRFRHVSSSALRDIEKFSPVEYRKYVVTD
jgi:pantetheine-phosphate adenylyltransferase